MSFRETARICAKARRKDRALGTSDDVYIATAEEAEFSDSQK